MIHLAILSILIVLIIGSFSLVFGWIVYQKEKNPLFGHHLLILLLISVNLIIIQTAFYIYHFKILDFLLPWCRLLSALVSCLIVSRSILVEYPAELSGRYRIANRAFIFLGIIMGLVSIAFFILSAEHFYFARNAIFILLIAGTTVNTVFIFTEKNAHDYRNGFDWNRYTKILLILYAILLPLFFIIIARKNAGSLSLTPYFLLYPVLYSIIHIFSAVYLSRYLIKPHYRIKSIKMEPVIAQKAGFSPRETEIAEMLADGLSYKKIGQILAISPETVKSHAKNIYLKTGASGRDNLIRIFQESSQKEDPDKQQEGKI